MRIRTSMLFQLLTLFLFSLVIGCLAEQFCTNVLGSHTLRYALETTKNETWKREVLSQINHRWEAVDYSPAGFLPRKMMRKEDHGSWTMLSEQMKSYEGANEKPEGFLKEVPLSDVRLDPDSMYGTAMQTNLEFLLMFDVDNLAWNFRTLADLPAPGHAYTDLEAPNCDLRGHFVGHFMSASALMWKSTNNDTLKERMDKLVSILSECQQKLGKGYLSAFPSSNFDRLETLQYVWAPYYVMHKIMAGLLDQHTVAGNDQALEVVKGMADYFYNRVQRVIQKFSIQRHWEYLNEEFGGMNDVLHRLYSITGDQKHLLLAHLFDKPCFLGRLAIQADDLNDFHGNAHIPIVVGAQMRYEAIGDPMYRDIGAYFMDIINASHVYATGGTTTGLFWTYPNRLGTNLLEETEESCTTYGMLKVARNLFRWTKELKYADYYERTLINGVLSIQRGRQPGVMIFALPQKPGASKAVSQHGWGAPLQSFWCCYGTGMESFSKLGDTIYFEEEGKVPGLYIIQYIPNLFTWRSGGVELKLDLDPVVSWSNQFQVAIQITSGKSTTMSTWNLRMPIWTDTKAVQAELLHGDGHKDQLLSLPDPGNYLSITKQWAEGDKITIKFPISLWLEAIKDDRPEYASLNAILYGPYLLAGLSKSDWDIKASPNASLTDWISPIEADYNDHLISLSQGSSLSSLTVSLDSVRLLQNPSVPGTSDAVDATIRLIPKQPNASISSPQDAIGKAIMLEPYGLPGMLVAHQGPDKPLHVIPSSSSNESSVLFNLVAGLDGKNGGVSLESANQTGCYMISDSSKSINLGCKTNSSRSDFNQAASFKLDRGISEYHPISFVAKGATRNFLLVPLLSLRDEYYTIYFNITSI